MNYLNGGEVLPPDLLEELQKYIQGALVYVPKRGKLRAQWGEKSGTKVLIMERNYEILKSYEKGQSIATLSTQYYLSEDSIRKIIRIMRQDGNI